MKIGSMLGVTAPMFIILADCYNQSKFSDLYTEFLNKVNNIANQEVVSDFKSELLFLAQTLDKFPISYKFPYVQSFKTDYGMCTNSHGTITGSSDVEEASINLDQEFTLRIVSKIVQSLNEEESYDVRNMCNMSDVEIKQFIYSIASDYIKNNDFKFNTLQKQVIKCMKNIEKTGESFDKSKLLNRLLNMYDGCVELPSSLNTDSGLIDFSDNELKVIEYFLDRKSSIQSLLTGLEIKNNTDDLVFDLSPQVLLNRKPISLLYIVRDKFSYVNHNATFLLKIKSEVQASLDAFKKIMKTRVISEKERDKQENLTISKIIELEQFKDDPYKKLFFIELFTTYFDPKEYDISDVNTLIEFYDAVSLLNLDIINNTLHTNFTAEEFSNSQIRLANVGITGLNLFSLPLFRDCIKLIVFTSNQYTVKTEEEIAEYERYIADIDALLETLLPLGGAI